MAEIDLMIDPPQPKPKTDPADVVPEVDRDTPAVSRPGDLWLLGPHRVYCGDALKAESYGTVLDGHLARLVFTDPPYNVKIDGHVSGLGKVAHREFAMASGEMSAEAFTSFLKQAFDHMAAHCMDGAIIYACMDWRHTGEILTAGQATFTEFKNLCVWNKTNGGMGSLYRSKHELVFVFKNGKGAHVNNVELGKHGRYRTNVWDYAGANTFRKGRDADLAAHPTVKPVALVADAIKDCSKRNDIILDPFGGSGSTLLAAHRTGRRAALIELDPHYTDTIVGRWQAMTGEAAILAGTQDTFDATARQRAGEEAPDASDA